MRGSAERIYDGYATHTLSMREYVLIHIIYSLHLYNEGIHTQGAMNWMTTSKSWVLWTQHDSLSSTRSNEDEEERKLQSLLEDCGWSLEGQGGGNHEGAQQASTKNKYGSQRNLKQGI